MSGKKTLGSLMAAAAVSAAGLAHAAPAAPDLSYPNDLPRTAVSQQFHACAAKMIREDMQALPQSEIGTAIENRGFALRGNAPDGSQDGAWLTLSSAPSKTVMYNYAWMNGQDAMSVGVVTDGPSPSIGIAVDGNSMAADIMREAVFSDNAASRKQAEAVLQRLKTCMKGPQP